MSEVNKTENPIKPFQIDSIDMKDRVVTLTIRCDCIGSVANQLKSCPDERRSVSAVRKLGHVLSDVGNVIFGNDDISKYHSLEGIDIINE
jgi:hypothetical protein